MNEGFISPKVLITIAEFVLLYFKIFFMTILFCTESSMHYKGQTTEQEEEFENHQLYLGRFTTKFNYLLEFILFSSEVFTCISILQFTPVSPLYGEVVETIPPFILHPFMVNGRLIVFLFTILSPEYPQNLIVNAGSWITYSVDGKPVILQIMELPAA